MIAPSDAQHAARRLAATLSPGVVSFREPDCLAASMDLWPRHLVRLYGGHVPTLPVAVVWPESVEMLQHIVCFARDVGLTLVPYGAGSSVVGGASAQPDHAVLDLKRMGAVHAINDETHTVTAQTGILGERLERQLQRAGFTQGHFPSSIYCSTLGGWLAARSAGQMSSLYGKIEDQVLGGTAVLGDGSLLHQKPSVVRDGRFEALIGSEGTLGVLAEATLRIHPLPEARWWRGLDFPTLPQALQAAQAWLQAGLSPSVARIYDPLDSFLHRGTHGHVEPHDRGPSITAAIGAYLPRLVGFLGDHVGSRCRTIVGLEGSTPLVNCDAETVLRIAQQHGAVDGGPGPGEAWYARRYAVCYRLSNAFRAGVAADTMEVACLWERVLPVYQAVKQAGLEAGAQVLAHFSHMYREGASIYFTFALPASGGENAYGALWNACLNAAVDAGANVSHHHGVGQLKRQVLHRAQGDGGAALEALRNLHDPARIFNPQALAVDADRVVARRPVPAPEEGPACLVPLDPQITVGEAEARLQARQLTLGPAAGLFHSRTVLEAARQRLLWRRNGQFGVVETALAGVDTKTFHYLPAPRAAQGPDLIEALLRGDVRRIWVRSDALGTRHLRHTDTLDLCLRMVRTLAMHPTGAILTTGVQAVDSAGATVLVELPADERRQALAVNTMREVTGAAVYSLQAEPASWPLISSDAAALVVAGPWDRLQPFLLHAVGAGATLHMPWVEKAGAAAVLVCHDAATATALRAQAATEDLLGEAQQTPAPALRVHHSPPSMVPPEASDAPSASQHVVSLRAHVGELDNCTYCPKLCRFSCPVAVDEATETWTPRQLMLTANLERRERRTMSPDVAAQLWACVDCRGCRSFCDHDNDVASVLRAARAELWEHGRAPAAVTRTLDTIIRQGALPNSGRVTVQGDGAQAPTWLWLSCQHNAASNAAQRGVLQVSREARGPVHVWEPPATARCCGHPLWRWGAKAAFQGHAARVASSLGAGVKDIVVDDPGCAYTLGTLYAQVGIAMPTVHSATSLLEENSVLAVGAGCAPHDACFARSWLHEPGLRSRIKGPWAKGSILEGQAGCCGGMLLPHYDAAVAEKVARAHAQDLLGGGAQSIVSASPTCSRRMRAVGAPVQDLWACIPPAV